MTELRELIYKFIEKKGKFQIIIIILICLNSIEVGISHTITSFHVYTPAYYCLDDPEQNKDPKTNCNFNCTTGYQFDENDDFTVAQEFSLVCERKFIGALINTLYFVGVTLGALICSSLCDLWGRKKMVIGCLYLQAFMSLGVAASSDLIMFIIFRFLQGFLVQGLQTCSYTLMIEYCPSRFRTMAAIFWESNWAAGLAILGFVSYFVPNWHHLTLVLLIPTALSLFYFWIIPESITWLYANKRYSESLRLITLAARKNKDTDLIEECNKVTLAQATQEEVDSKADKYRLTDVVRNPILRKHVLVMTYVAFCVTLSYYVILYFLPGLGGSRHINFIIGAAIEVVAYIIQYFILTRFGRRIPMILYQFVNMGLIILLAILNEYNRTEKSEILSEFLSIFALIAKAIAVSCFVGMFMFSSELFPTVCRAVGLGLCVFAARIGSLVAPQILLLKEILPEFVPLIIVCGLLLISGLAIILMPETVSTTLPDTIEEANKLWGKG